MKKHELYMISVLILFVIIGANSVDAWSESADDASNYDAWDYVASIWCFNFISVSTDTGEIQFRGSNPYDAVHYGRFWIAMQFTAGDTGQVTCTVDYAATYNLIADGYLYGYSDLSIRLVLMNSAYNPLDTDEVYDDRAYCSSSGVTDYAKGTPSGELETTWSYSCQNDVVYYAALEVYVELYKHGYAFSESGSVADPSQFEFDISEITVSG
ncbi:hypothetical protein EU537_06060 [Candidatus Thorarchaeota archaeon]|nr:MAG: hypothetical protein EU537_06060 [Candidatus Thorarchaeota archaeon]